MYLLTQASSSRDSMKYVFKTLAAVTFVIDFSVRLFEKSARCLSIFSSRFRLSFLLLSLIPFYTSTSAWAASSNEELRGLWIDHKEPEKQKVAVWIEDCNGTLCGRIYWMKRPLNREGKPKTDAHNPDPNLRERPLCGLRVLSGFKRTDEVTWADGQIYSPSDGNTFSSTIKLEREGAIKIRGYVGISLFGKTLEWVRPTEKLQQCT